MLDADVLNEDPPDVDVMTPERFAAMLRTDPKGVLDRVPPTQISLVLQPGGGALGDGLVLRA
ncbi:MAG: hypothetical protein ACR2H2_04720 [Solirubrobacteraceae bacterium]